MMPHKALVHRIIPLALLVGFGLAAAGTTATAASAPGKPGLQAAAKQEIVYKPIPKAGKKFDIDADTAIIYEFNEKPKMGTAFLKIQVFNKKGDKITPFVITGRSDMPSMRGAHDSGDVEFKLNKKNDYLLPVNVVMPGDWEVRVIFLKDGKPVFYGSITFDV